MQQIVIATTEEHAGWECRVVARMSGKVVGAYQDRMGRILNSNPMLADQYGKFSDIFLPVGDYVLALRSADGKEGRSEAITVPFVQVIP